MFRIVKRDKGLLCQAHACMNEKRIENGIKKDRFCYKHRHRYRKYNNTLRYVYDALRCNAIRRDKNFNLTLKEFGQFCEETNYLELRGKTGKSASIVTGKL